MLSVFGATYTVIAAFRGHYDKRVQQVRGDAVKQASSIKDLTGDGTTAPKLRDKVAFWERCWTRSHAVPIALFGFFSLFMGMDCVVNWSEITASASSLSANSSTVSNQASVKDSSVSSAPLVSQEYRVPGYWRWVLCVILFVNGTCLLVAYISGQKVQSLGLQLTNMEAMCQKTKAKESVTRGDVSAVPSTPAAGEGQG
jgi:hypothetical protein